MTRHDGLGRFEPSCTVEPLRACACGEPHPRATGAGDLAACPRCHAPLAPSAAFAAEAIAPDLGLTWLEFGLLALGRALRGLARRF